MGLLLVTQKLFCEGVGAKMFDQRVDLRQQRVVLVVFQYAVAHQARAQAGKEGVPDPYRA